MVHTTRTPSRKKQKRSSRTRRSARRRTKTLRGGSRGKDTGTNYKKIAAIGVLGTAAVLGGLALVKPRIWTNEKALATLQVDVLGFLAYLDPCDDDNLEALNDAENSLKEVFNHYVARIVVPDKTTDTVVVVYDYVKELVRLFKNFSNRVNAPHVVVNNTDVTAVLEDIKSKFDHVSKEDAFRIYKLKSLKRVVATDQTRDFDAFNTLTANLNHIITTWPPCQEENSDTIEAALFYLAGAQVRLNPSSSPIFWVTRVKAMVTDEITRDDAAAANLIRRLDEKTFDVCDGTPEKRTEINELLQSITGGQTLKSVTKSNDEKLYYHECFLRNLLNFFDRPDNLVRSEQHSTTYYNELIIPLRNSPTAQMIENVKQLLQEIKQKNCPELKAVVLAVLKAIADAEVIARSAAPK